MRNPLLLGQSNIYTMGLRTDLASREYWVSSVKPSIRWPLLGMGPDEDEKPEEFNNSISKGTLLVSVDYEKGIMLFKPL